jgi:hypothetical protein
MIGFGAGQLRRNAGHREHGRGGQRRRRGCQRDRREAPGCDSSCDLLDDCRCGRPDGAASTRRRQLFAGNESLLQRTVFGQPFAAARLSDAREID